MSNSFPPGQRRDLPVRRLLALLAASVLMHLLAFGWIKGSLGLPSWPRQGETVIAAQLHPLPVTMPPAAPAPLPRKAVNRKPATPQAHPPQAPVRSSPAAQESPTVQEPPAVPDAESGMPVAREGRDGDAAATAAIEQQDAGAADTKAQTAAPADKPSYKFSAPPSAELQYQVNALREGQQWHGAGLLRWNADGDRYEVNVEASIRLIFKITVLNSKSEGSFSESGVAPVLYSEKPFRRTMTNTHFQKDAHKISFSASEATYPYEGGEQDRASIVWQLAGMGRGSPEQFKPGAEFTIVVAGARDAEPWHIQVLGEEETDTAQGRMPAWHVVRARRPGSYDTSLDIWFAPRNEWYPVRIRYTYPNADYLDMSLSEIAPAAAH